MEVRNLGSARMRVPESGVVADNFEHSGLPHNDRIDPALLLLVASARETLKVRQKKHRTDEAFAKIRQWKSEGVYPFVGASEDAIEEARREMFDICALSIHDHVDVFRTGTRQDRRFTLQMLKATLEDSPATLRRILTEVLNLPEERANGLTNLFQLTSLSSIIEASKMVTDRLQFLSGLQALLFESGSKHSFRERDQLHRMLANETWIFGEEFQLTSSDENLTTVLHKHIGKLDGGHASLRNAVLRDNGREGVVDLVLGRELPAYANLRREFLVVELKRPSRKIDLAAKAQLESYAMAVASDERFDTASTHWTFLAVSNDITPEASRMLGYSNGTFGCTHQDRTLRIGLSTWGGILNAARVRMEAFRSKLNCTITRDDGLAWLRQRYDEYLPDSVRSTVP